MSEISNGGPAFPMQWRQRADSEGMSLLDYFAGQALPKVIAFDRNRGMVGTPDEAAQLAYQYAACMLQARVRAAAEIVEAMK